MCDRFSSPAVTARASSCAVSHAIGELVSYKKHESFDYLRRFGKQMHAGLTTLQA